MTHTFVAGEVPPEWAAELITNPAAWADEQDTPSDAPVVPERPEPVSLDDMTKDELLVEVARLRDEGVDLEVNSSSRKDEILDALRSYLEG